MFFRGVIANDDLQVMEAALVLASDELGLADDDVNGREHLARSILALYRAGQSDAERLTVYAVSQFKGSHDNNLISYDRRTPATTRTD